MNPKELRIGNYVWCLASVRGLFIPFAEVKILTLGFDKAETCLIDQIPAQVEEWPKYEYNRIDPIHLTPEWLEKFGLKVHDELVAWGRRVDTKYVDINEGLMLIYTNEKDDVYGWYLAFLDVDEALPVGIEKPEIKHVHQFQNLWYALTGEELTLQAAPPTPRPNDK